MSREPSFRGKGMWLKESSYPTRISSDRFFDYTRELERVNSPSLRARSRGRLDWNAAERAVSRLANPQSTGVGLPATISAMLLDPVWELTAEAGGRRLEAAITAVYTLLKQLEEARESKKVEDQQKYRNMLQQLFYVKGPTTLADLGIDSNAKEAILEAIQSVMAEPSPK